MPRFEFIAKQPDGKNVRGTLEAANAQAVLELLTAKGLYPVEVELKKKGFSDAMQISIIERVKVKDLVIFSRQLAVMASAALPLVQALRIMVNQTENPLLKKIIAQVADAVDGGAKFSEALSSHPKIFSDFFVSMVRSGETSGRLDDVLSYLADQQERDYDLMSKIRGAMIYPAFIVFGLFAVGIVMMIFVIPRLTAVLQETGAELPGSTKILIAVSNFLTNFWWLLGALAIIGLFGFKAAIKNQAGKRLWDLFKIHIPVFGRLFRFIYLVRLTRSLFTLVRGGVPLPLALTITADVVSNELYRELIMQTKKEVDDGNPVSTVFVKSSAIPVMASQMMNVGEQTGRLDQILEKLTAFYSREIENMVSNLVSLIEPLIMVVLGVAVGLMVAAIILPMYNLASGF